MTIYSVGCIVTGEPPQLLVAHLGHGVTGWTPCFAVTPLIKPYACQAAWAASVLGRYSLGSQIFERLTETLKTSENLAEKSVAVQVIQDVIAKLVAWSTELRECNEGGGGLTPEMVTGGWKPERLHQVCSKCNCSCKKA